MSNIPNISQVLPEFIKRCIDERVKEATVEEIEQAKIRLEKRKDEIIAGVLLNIHKEMDMQSMGDRLVISVRTNTGRPGDIKS